MNCSMHHDRMHAVDGMWEDMFHRHPMMALTDGRHGDLHQQHRDDRHGRELQPGRPRSSDVAPRGGQHDPFSFMSSMMSNMHNMMGNAFQQAVCNITRSVVHQLFRRLTFLPRDSNAKRGICRRRVCVCVCHTPVLYQNG